MWSPPARVNLLFTLFHKCRLPGASPMEVLLPMGQAIFMAPPASAERPALELCSKHLRPVPPSTKWTEIALYTFAGGSDGKYPYGGLVFDSVGNLYGTTTEGGASGLGVVFQLTPPMTQGGKWTELVLHSFQGGSSDGSNPVSTVVFDSKGNLYGVTLEGGAPVINHCPQGCGTVFQLTPPATQGGNWAETVIRYFNFGNGGYPRGTPIFDAKGNLYGTASQGGLHDRGLVYRLTPPATQGGAWAPKVLYTFMGSTTADGGQPWGSLTLHKGDLYGTANLGGPQSYGTVFELVPPPDSGGVWTEKILLSFGNNNNDGSYPYANVIFDKAGNLYSTTSLGGGGGTCNFGGCGTVFELVPPATEDGSWTQITLHAFGVGKDASAPSGGVTLRNGVLFGVTETGGAGGKGAVFGILP